MLSPFTNNIAYGHSHTQCFRCLDKLGLLLKSQGDKLTPAQASFAKDDSEWPDDGGLDLLSVVRMVKPHVLIGTSTKPGAFTEEIIKEMAKHVEHPIIFPLSNPTRLHEAQPQDITKWTEGRALIATGSPFPPVEYNGTKKEIGELSDPHEIPSVPALIPLTGLKRNVTIQLSSPALALGQYCPELAVYPRQW